MAAAFLSSRRLVLDGALLYARAPFLENGEGLCTMFHVFDSMYSVQCALHTATNVFSLNCLLMSSHFSIISLMLLKK